jgi:hypothetical protein
MARRIQIKRGLYADMPVLAVGELAYCTDIKKLFVGTAEGINVEVVEAHDIDPEAHEGLLHSQVEITWQELKDLRDSSALVPGREYRITDYVTTTAQANTQSAGHQFDIIVTADDVDKLNENARACLHEGDTYFANSKLEAWKLKYCLDNDTDRFAWADEVNGKGVIYRMIDEFNNDVPYDFKNIQFYHSDDDSYYYTFTVYDDADTGDIVDVSTIQNRFMNDENGYSAVSGNIIKPWLEGPYNEDINGHSYTAIKLNGIMFINKTSYDAFYGIEGNIFGRNCYGNTFGSGCSYNTFGNDCSDNTFGNDCSDNTFGNYCSNNTFGEGCYSNTFGNSCYANTFGNYCFDNTFGNGCSDNTFGSGCSYNTFGNDCYYNTFGNYCYSNTFGNYCHGNTFGDDCYSNTFGNYCYSNTFGDNCSYNTFGDYCLDNTFGNNCTSNTFGENCQYLKISDNTGIQKKYISVDNGFNGASSANQFDLYDPAILNKNYQVTFKKSASGKYLMLWATDTGSMAGKYKESNIDTTWEDIV